jgi:hypothetical protein
LATYELEKEYNAWSMHNRGVFEMDRVRIHEIELKKPVYCPWCRAEHKEASGIDTDDRPHPGDTFICIGCGMISLWLGASELRRPTHEEAEKARQIPGVLEVLLAWQLTYRGRHGH